MKRNRGIPSLLLPSNSKRQNKLTLDVREGAEGAPGAVAGGLDVVALGALVDLRVELLLGARVAILTRVPCLAVGRVAPLVRGLYLGAGRGAVLELLRAPALVLAVVELRAGVSLAAEPRGLLAGLRLVVGEHVGGVQPLGVVVDEGALLVEAVETDDRVHLAGLDGLEFPKSKERKKKVNIRGCWRCFSRSVRCLIRGDLGKKPARIWNREHLKRSHSRERKKTGGDSS